MRKIILFVSVFMLCVALSVWALRPRASYNVEDRMQFAQTMSLYYAAERGDLQVVQDLINQGYDVNIVCDISCAGWTPVMIASANGHFDVVEFLLKNGANPNVQNNRGRTALAFATKYRFIPIVNVLLEYGADPKLTSEDENGKWSAMADAMIGAIKEPEAYEILRMFVQKTGDVNFMYYDYTPLLMAVYYDDYDFAKYLLENGADVNHVKVIKDKETGQDINYTVENMVQSEEMLFLVMSYKK